MRIGSANYDELVAFYGTTGMEDERQLVRSGMGARTRRPSYRFTCLSSVRGFLGQNAVGVPIAISGFRAGGMVRSGEAGGFSSALAGLDIEKIPPGFGRSGTGSSIAGITRTSNVLL